MYLSCVEDHLGEKKNFDLFQTIMTKQGDSSFKFHSMIDRTQDFFQAVFSKVEMGELQRIRGLVSQGVLFEKSRGDTSEDAAVAAQEVDAQSAWIPDIVEERTNESETVSYSFTAEYCQ